MTKKRPIISSIIIGGMIVLFKVADMFSPGSYGHAERYELDYPEEKVIEVIRNLKGVDRDLVISDNHSS